MIQTICRRLGYESDLREIVTIGTQILGEVRQLMAAIDDLKAGQAAIDKAVLDVVAFLKNLATTVSDGVSKADAETVAADLIGQAAALEAAIAPPPAPAQ
jgi:hypothetical protein